MDLAGIGLLAVAALLHSVWNLLARRSANKQVFLWTALVVGSAGYLVPGLLLYHPLPAAAWGLIALSGGLEAVYFLLLGSAYQRGDLSLVYPLARGTALLAVAVLARTVLGERITPTGVLGIGLVVGGMVVLHVRTLDRAGLLAPLRSLRERPSQLAVLTGLTTAGYSLVDKVGVPLAGPWLYLWLIFVVAAVALAPYMLLARRAAVRAEWQANRPAILVTAGLFFAAYGLVLVALTRSPVSYVAAVREISVVFAALRGTLVLREPFAGSKTLGATLIFAGILVLGVVG